MQEAITLIINKKYLYILCTVIFLVSLNFFIGSEYREDLLNVFWNSDDVFHISIADNFRNEKNFEQQYISMRYASQSENYFLDLYPNISENPQGSKGPIYYVLLGTFYEILSTSHDDLYLHGSYFNNLLSSIFLILFFFLVKRYFDIKVAIISSVIISFIPGFGQMSTRIMIDPLLFIFLLSSLFFLKRKIHHYILFGIFSGLAILTHPTAISLIVSYSIFSLFKRNFIGFSVSLITFNFLIIPWMLRNFYFFSDFGKGLYLPFSHKISNFISSLFNEKSNLNPVPDQANSFNFELFLSSKNLIVTSTQDTMFHSGYLIIFLVIFVTLSFFNFDKFSKKQKYFFLLLLSLFLISVLFFSFFEIPFLIIITFFCIISILIFTIYLKNKYLIIHNIPDIQFFILLSFFTHFLIMTTFAIFANWSAIGVRYYIFYLIILVPIAIFGLDMFLKRYIPKTTFDKKTIYFFIVLFIILSIVIDLGYGHESLRNQIWIYESSQMKQVNEIIKKLDVKGNIASNYPEEVWYRTGINSIQLPTYITTQTNFENYLRTFNIDYIVFYNNVDNNYPKTELQQHLHNFHYGSFFYSPHISETSIIRVIDIFDENVVKNLHQSDNLQFFSDLDSLESFVDIVHENAQLSSTSVPIDLVKAMYIMENMEHIDISEKLRSSLLEFDSDVKMMQEICMNLHLFQYYDESIQKCMQLLENDNNNIFALITLENNNHQYVEIEKRTSLHEFLNNEHDQSYVQNVIEYMERYYEHLDKTEILFDIFPPDPNIFSDSLMLSDFHIYFPVVIEDEHIFNSNKIYDLQINILTKQLEILKNMQFVDAADIKETQLSNEISTKAKFFELMKKKKTMNSDYENILRDIDTKSVAHQKLAIFNENLNEFELALHHYELSLKLEPRNEFFKEKIQELNSILEYQSLINCHADPCSLLPT